MAVVDQFVGEWDKESARTVIELEKDNMLSKIKLKSAARRISEGTYE